MLILQGFAEPSVITQGYALAPQPAGGLSVGGPVSPAVTRTAAAGGGLRHSGSPTAQQSRGICGQYYPGGASGEPFPEPMPEGPLLICWQDPETGQYRSEVMGAVEQEPDPPGWEINPGSIGWEQVIAWWPLSESDL